MKSQLQPSRLSRRQILKGSAGVMGLMAASGTLSACANDSASSDGTIRIAVTSATSGALAIYGRSVLDLIPFAVDYLNGQAGEGGRRIEFKTYPNNGETADVMRAAEAAVNQDGFNILTGYFSSAQSAALQQALDRLGLLFIDPDAQADGLTGETCHPLYFRTVPSVSMNLNTLGEGVRDLGISRWSSLSSDYAFGHDAYNAFKTLAEDSGATVEDGHFPPLTSADYGSYITQLLDEGTQGLFTGVAGADAITFFNQASRFGLIDHFDAIVGVNSFDVLTFEGIGEAAVGLYGVPGYDPSLDNQRNRDFVEAFTEEFGREPYYIEANTFVALESLLAAVDESGSTEPETVAETLSGSTPDTIMGTIEIRAEDHQVQRENWFGRIVSDPSSPAGGLAWEVATAVDRQAVSTPVSADCQI